MLFVVALFVCLFGWLVGCCCLFVCLFLVFLLLLGFYFYFFILFFEGGGGLGGCFLFLSWALAGDPLYTCSFLPQNL